MNAPRTLRLFLGAHKAMIAALVVVSLTAGLCESAILVIVAQVAAALVDGSSHVSATVGGVAFDAGVGLLLALALGIAALRLALGMLVAYLPARVSADVQFDVRNQLFSGFSRAPWAVQAEEREGHLQELITGQIVQATQGVVQAATFVSAFFCFLALVVSALVLNVPVALVVMGTGGLLFVALRPLNRLGHRQARGLSAASLEYAHGVSEAVRLAEETKVFDASAEQQRSMQSLAETTRGLFFRTQFVGRFVQSTYQGLVILLIVAGLAGLYWSGAGHIATLGAAVLMLVRSAAYGQQAQSSYHLVQQAAPFLERLRAAEQRYVASAPAPGFREFSQLRCVRFEHVSFAYGRGARALDDLTFEVRANEAIGIVGPSGAGKSTLVQLLLRLRAPTRGVYLINDEPADEISNEEWQRQVAYVPQEPQLLNATVAENIRFFRDIDDAAIEQAARFAHIHEDIASWVSGYDTVIGQRADAVSGGQRQRICLARALVGNPQILVLDEPTSALDLRSEALVQESLELLRGRVTFFIVAHRLSMLSSCDRVLVMARGTTEAFASPSELAVTNPFFMRARALSGLGA